MLRAIIGFDHVVKNVNDTWMPTCGYALSKSTPGNNRPFIINSDGALQSTSVSAALAQTNIDFSRYLTGPVSGFTIGMRLKQVVVGNGGAAVYICSDVALSGFMNLVNFASLPNVGVAGSETYLEMSFDLTAGTVSYWLDDVFLSTAGLSGVSLANLRAGTVLFAWNHAAANTLGVMSVKDIYFIDNVPGDGYTGRLGPRKTYPITIDSAAGSGWTASDGGSLLAALNTQIETAGATISSDVTKSPLSLSLSSSVPNGAIVDGISLFSAAKVDVSTSLTAVKLVNGANNIAGGSKTTPTTMRYGNPLGAYARAPDGSRWTAASIDSTSLVLTPDVVS